LEELGSADDSPQRVRWVSAGLASLFGNFKTTPVFSQFEFLDLTGLVSHVLLANHRVSFCRAQVGNFSQAPKFLANASE
jgi:hypothetical protein